MAELRLTVNGEDLDLPDDLTVSVEWNSPLLGEEQPGSLTFPFNLPLTPRNAHILGYGHLPQVRADRRRRYPEAVLSCGPLRMVGEFQCREAGTRTYQANLVVPPRQRAPVEVEPEPAHPAARRPHVPHGAG